MGSKQSELTLFGWEGVMEFSELVALVGGIALIAALASWFFGPKKSRAATMKGDVQEVEISVKGGYSPDRIIVEAGKPVRLIFDRQENSDCTSRVVFPDLQLSRSLKPFGATIVEFTPEAAGTIPFACGMNMIHGAIQVTPASNGAKPIERPDTGTATPVAEAVGVGPQAEVQPLSEATLALMGGAVSCPTCVVNIESFLQQIPGVSDVNVNFGTERATVRYDADQAEPRQFKAAVEELGYRAEILDGSGADARDEDWEQAAIRVTTASVSFTARGHSRPVVEADDEVDSEEDSCRYQCPAGAHQGQGYDQKHWDGAHPQHNPSARFVPSHSRLNIATRPLPPRGVRAPDQHAACVRRRNCSRSTGKCPATQEFNRPSAIVTRAGRASPDSALPLRQSCGIPSAPRVD